MTGRSDRLGLTAIGTRGRSTAGRTRALILFDLDGTVSDSASGILASLRYAFDVHGLPRLDVATERTLLGPPFHQSLPPLLGDVPLATFSATFRARYHSGAMFDATVFAGMAQLIAELHRAGVVLAIATSKPEISAVPIVEHLGLSKYFAVIGGDDQHGSGTKAGVIGRVLARLGDPDPATVLMVGDRVHDVDGAQKYGIDCIGVRWGYAPPGELEAARTLALCSTVPELAKELSALTVAGGLGPTVTGKE